MGLSTNSRDRKPSKKTKLVQKPLFPQVKPQFAKIKCPECLMIFEKKNKKSEELHNFWHLEKLKGKIISKSLINKILKESETVIPIDVLIKETANIQPTSEKKGTKETLNLVILKSIDKQVIKAIEDVLKIVNKEWLNTPQSSNNWKTNPNICKVVLIISSDNRIVGLTTTDPPTNQGFKMNIKTSDIEKETFLNLQVGISRIYISQWYRRLGLATKMLNLLLTNAVYGANLSKWDIGFSQPSSSGIVLAQKWYNEPLYIPVYEEPDAL